MAIKPDNAPLVVVVGETASGKSALSMSIAGKYNGEIICADSRTIYKGMDIGTAKPTQQERDTVPHHLLDMVAPGEYFTAADFKASAETVIHDIGARGKLPIIVGGTGLYVDAVLFNYTFAGRANAQERHRLEELDVASLRLLVEQKGLLPPENSENRRHLVRTIEKGESSPNDRATMRENTIVVGLTIGRNTLRKRIEQRVEQMFRKGLRKEVEELVAKYGWEHEALTGIGYREFKAYYDQQASMSEVKRKITQDTLHLAKRQRTWFKRNPSIQWFETPEEAMGAIDAFLTHTGYNQV